MKTVITESTKEAAGFIARGGVVAFPTETVYGLGADIYNDSAIRRVFAAKGRPSDNPLIAHISNTGQIETIADSVSDDAQTLIERFFPGPLTIVVEKSDHIPDIATAGLVTVGIRMPDHQLALELISACRTPLVAPSANLSGRPSPTTWQAVLEDLEGRIDCILKGEPTEHGIESTVVDCTGPVPQVLRLGSISIEKLQEVVPGAYVASTPATDKPKSPGLRHRHYSPTAKVVIYGKTALDQQMKPLGFIGLTDPFGEFSEKLICDSVESYARSLFEFFRRCDRNGIQTVFCEPVKGDDIGAALMDRIQRAAEK